MPRAAGAIARRSALDLPWPNRLNRPGPILVIRSIRMMGLQSGALKTGGTRFQVNSGSHVICLRFLALPCP